MRVCGFGCWRALRGRHYTGFCDSGAALSNRRGRRGGTLACGVASVRNVGFVGTIDGASTRDDNIFPGNVTRSGSALADRRSRAVQPGGSLLLSDDLNAGRETSKARSTRIPMQQARRIAG